MKIKKFMKAAALAALCALPASAQALDSFNCKVTEVYVFSDRVHVKCAEAPPPRGLEKFQYFAVPTSNSDEAARFTSIASIALGGYLWVEYDWYDYKAQWFGCQFHDCRQALTFGLR